MKYQTFKILKDQLKSIIELVKQDKATTESLERNWNLDRQDLREVIDRVGHLELEVKSLKEIVSKIPQSTQDKVAEVMEPARESAQDLQDAIFKKKMIALDPQVINGQDKKKRHWYLFF